MLNPGRVAVVHAMASIDEQEPHDLWDTFSRGLVPRDRALANFLLQGTLRQRPHVDEALNRVLKQSVPNLETMVRAVLRVGAFEALRGRTPRRAVVHQYVECAKRVGAFRAKGLVNAVLRRVQALKDPTGEAAHGHPTWLMSRWERRYGLEAALQWARQNQEPSTTSLVMRDGVDIPQVLREGEVALSASYAAGEPVPGVYSLQGGGAVHTLPGFEQGLFWVQDPAAAAVADLVPITKDVRVLDACAAPGGKAFRLVSKGADVTAVDRGESRLRLIEENAERLGQRVISQQHDWLLGPCPDIDPFPSVILDAPCTGLGTVGRHPEIRWRRTGDDLRRCRDRQQTMLASVAQHVQAGGHLVYSVCSVEPEETEHVARHFENEHTGWERELTWSSGPPTHGEDAHFAVRWRAPK